MALVRTQFFSSLVTWSVVNLTGSSTAAGQGAQGGRPGRWWRPQLPAASMMTINTGAAQVSVEPSRLIYKEMNVEPHLTCVVVSSQPPPSQPQHYRPPPEVMPDAELGGAGGGGGYAPGQADKFNTMPFANPAPPTAPSSVYDYTRLDPSAIKVRSRSPGPPLLSAILRPRLRVSDSLASNSMLAA